MTGSGAPFPDFSSTTYSLWFFTETRGWQTWSGEQTTPEAAESMRDNCLRQFPGATAIVVERVTSRKAVR